MGTNVFANGRGLSGKANANKSLGAMPDVCLSPPSPPAGPIPIPYPNFSQASDTSGGSKKVKMNGKEIGLKNKSDYKKSKGNEAATKSFGMGVISHNLSGGMKHVAWSFDVKIEKQNAIRHFDLTIHNHGSASNAATGLNAESQMPPSGKDPTCAQLTAQAKADEAASPSRGCAARALVKKEGKRWNVKSRPVKRKTHARGEAKGAFNTKKPQKPHKSNMCKKGGEFKYGGGCQSRVNDAEARIIEDVAKKFGSTMKNVSVKMAVTKRPCPSCQRVICHAQKCGLDIKLCLPGKTRPEKPKCKKDKGSGKKSPGPMDEQLPPESKW